MLTVFGNFLSPLYFPHSNSNIKFVFNSNYCFTNMPMSRHKVSEVNVFHSLFWNFYFCSYENCVTTSFLSSSLTIHAANKL